VNIFWSAEARKALRSIRRFIAQDSEFYAARTVARIIERVEITTMEPKRGHPVHEYPEEPLKEVHESPYRIIYSVSDDNFRVITIVHFRQRLTKDMLVK
jgi:toxin ParE1/3/4